MAPVEVASRTRWARRWKRSAKTTEQSASRTRNNPRSEDAELPMSALRGTARLSVKFKRGGQGRAGGEDGDSKDDGDRRGRSPFPSRRRSRRRDEDSESDDRGDAESDYDVGEDADLEDDLEEGGDRDTSEPENEEDSTGQDNGLPPSIPNNPSPPYTTSTPLIETTASMAPSNGAEGDVPSTTVAPVSETTVGPVDGPTATMTPVIQGVINDEDRPISTVHLSIIEPTAAELTPDPSTTTTTITSPSSEVPNGPKFDRVGSNDDDFGGRGGLGPPPPDRPHRLAQGAEHALIAVGAIGAFILFCFVAWLMYLAVRRFRNNSAPASRSPWKPKDSNDGPGAKSPTHMANKSVPVSEGSVASMLEAQGYYARAPVDPAQSGGHPFTGTLGSQQGTLLQPPNYEATYVYGHTPGIEPPPSPGMNLATGQPRMSGPNNQPVADSQPSAMDDAIKRQAYRDSEISSLSSGFGDGDIVIQQSLTAPPPPVAPRQEPPQPPPRTPNYLGRFSWISRSSSSGRRETVYTQTSEDRPARFRSINSWVNQQAGRVRRANSRAKERGEVPVMPAVPGELNVTQQTAYK
ncbi:hypothetical protein DL766_000740 [Monosporascus sp. MC13-8B]|uniref:Transmembrane protein n=1 Tax=Monosporascus cannonballus TaxID=155416 RepID=A0ABY0H8W6_9PEZI|nr:hypothetical protein DL762_004022 [Monosporascus cannonballus]RYO97781.1 hypothetical protein DL763_002577 [Monosporascus cannonballus]RYP38931.1 hypothetical protein DL766_000740 [Monosporascus sp. MC13-8B]